MVRLYERLWSHRYYASADQSQLAQDVVVPKSNATGNCLHALLVSGRIAQPNVPAQMIGLPKAENGVMWHHSNRASRGCRRRFRR